MRKIILQATITTIFQIFFTEKYFRLIVKKLTQKTLSIFNYPEENAIFAKFSTFDNLFLPINFRLESVFFTLSRTFIRCEITFAAEENKKNF